MPRRLTTVAICWLLIAPLALAQGGPRPRKNVPFPDPNEFFEKFFGPDTKSERERANRVKISFREEAKAGSSALASFQRQLRRRRIKLLSRGDDVTYIQGLVAELRQQGFAAFRSRLTTSSGELHRVRIGPQKDRDSAEEMAARLQRVGHKGQVVPHP